MLYLVLSLFLAKGFRWIKYQLHHQSLSSLTWGQSPHLLPPRWLAPQMSKPSWPGALSGRVLLVVKGYKDCLWYVKKKLHTWRIVYLGFRIYKWYIYIYIIAYIYTITNAHIYLNSMIPWQDEISSPSGDFHMPCSKIIPLVRWFSHFCTSTG
jgi:hypothetical protein